MGSEAATQLRVNLRSAAVGGQNSIRRKRRSCQDARTTPHFPPPRWQSSSGGGATCWSRTCSCATNSRSPCVLVLDPTSGPGTGSSGWWSAASTRTRCGISSWSDQKPSSAGTAKAGDSTGAGAQAATRVAPDCPEIRALIATIASANPLWGTERIRGELLKLGIVVSSRSIRRYRRRRHWRSPSQSWSTFLANHARAIWAADLFVDQTLTFQTLYVIFLISHGRRELLHFEVTAHPTAAWVWRQLIEATPWNRKRQCLIHDRDGSAAPTSATASPSWTSILCGRQIRAPRANSIAERWVRTVRRECLDHLIPLSERHLRRTVAEFATTTTIIGLTAAVTSRAFWAVSTTPTDAPLELDRLLPSYGWPRPGQRRTTAGHSDRRS